MSITATPTELRWSPRCGCIRSDDELKLAFEAVATFDPEDKAMATRIIQGLILQHQAKIWSKAS